jgi:hypothetical protein
MGFVNVCQFLLDKEANPDQKTVDGWTPLHVATSKVCLCLCVCMFLSLLSIVRLTKLKSKKQLVGHHFTLPPLKYECLCLCLRVCFCYIFCLFVCLFVYLFIFCLCLFVCLFACLFVFDFFLLFFPFFLRTQTNKHKQHRENTMLFNYY